MWWQADPDRPKAAWRPGRARLAAGLLLPPSSSAPRSAWRSSPPSLPPAPAPCSPPTPRAPGALTGGFQRALLACAIFLPAAAVIALRHQHP